MSQLRERIALLITTAENQGWHTIVAPIDFLRAAFLDSPAGMELRLRRRAIGLTDAASDSTLGTADRTLLDEAADMIAALSAPMPEEVAVPGRRLHLINLIDIIDHALLYLPSGVVRENAQATRNDLWNALRMPAEDAAETAASDDAPAANGEGDGVDTADEEDDGLESSEVEGFAAKASIDDIATVLREVLASARASDEAMTEETIIGTAERIDRLYTYDLQRLMRERLDAKQFEKSMIDQWLEAHERSIDAERRALKARQREREAVERCAMIAEEPVDLPPDARAIRLAVHAVQRHIAAVIRKRGLSG